MLFFLIEHSDFFLKIKTQNFKNLNTVFENSVLFRTESNKILTSKLPKGVQIFIAIIVMDHSKKNE